MNKRTFLSVFFLLIGIFFVGAQDINPMLSAFQKSFARGSLSTKIQVLQDSSKVTDKSMGPLYLQSLRFIIVNNVTLHDDAAAKELTRLTIRLSGLRHYNETADLMWKLFNETSDSGIQIEILSALGELKPSQTIVTKLNDWLRDINGKAQKGDVINTKLFTEAVSTLGKIGDASSFNVVFSTAALHYSDAVTEAASSALKKLGTDYTTALIDVIKNNVPREKLMAVNLAVSSTNLTSGNKGRIFQAALTVGLTGKGVGKKDTEILRSLRFEGAKQLTKLKWTSASPLALENFKKTRQEVESGLASTSQLVESIKFLGSVNTHEAAVQLSMYLEVLNSLKERGQQVKTQVIMAVINSLGELGDKSAFDNLLYTGYLDYPSSVKKAAREALNNLKTD